MRIVHQFVETVLNYYSSGSSKNPIRGFRDSEHLTYGPKSPEASFLQRAMEIADFKLNKVAEGLRDAGYKVAILKFKLDSQGLVGMSEGLFKPAFEVGLTVDPVLGLPYYPGSTVKGGVRSFYEGLAELDLSKDESKEDGSELEKARRLAELLFGTQNSCGTLFFSDMFPVGCASSTCSVYKKMVITPHDKKMHDKEMVITPHKVQSKGRKPKTNPIKFIGIEEGTVFKLVIAVSPRVSEFENELKELLNSFERWDVVPKSAKPEDILEFAAAISIVALRTGIAARSNKGYNIFEYVSSPDAYFQKFSVVGYEFPPKSQGSESNEKWGARGRGFGSPAARGKRWKSGEV